MFDFAKESILAAKTFFSFVSDVVTCILHCRSRTMVAR